MTTLRIALQDGFEGDPVVVSVNGKQVFDQENVKTKRQIGNARSFDVKVDEETANVEISLPSRKLSERITVKMDGKVYLGISITRNRIEHKVSAEPFHYA